MILIMDNVDANLCFAMRREKLGALKNIGRYGKNATERKEPASLELQNQKGRRHFRRSQPLSTYTR
jgi:hypothetical protein